MSTHIYIGTVYEHHCIPHNASVVDVKYCEVCGLSFVRKNRDRICQRCHSNPHFPELPVTTIEILQELADEQPLSQ
jgi:hypothetical protein